jgi:glycosyltransferase involved in cell wall biosynthesis
MSDLRLELQREIDMTRSRLAVPDSVVLELERYRLTPEYAQLYEKAEPLVTVTISTYNRARLLVERSLRSVLDQDYSALEVIVVGDGCTDDTEERIRAIADERVTYLNFVDRTIPAHLGAGAEPANLALSMARGDLITHLDDDDEFTPDRIGKLVRFLQESHAEFVWHPFWWQESTSSEWAVNEAEALQFVKVTSSSVLYLSWFKRLAWDALAFRYHAPGDWTLFRTMRDIGARTERYPEPLLRHYKEGQNPRWADGQ